MTSHSNNPKWAERFLLKSYIGWNLATVTVQYKSHVHLETRAKTQVIRQSHHIFRVMPFFLLCEHLRILALTIHPFCASFLGTDVNGDFGNPDHFPPKNVVFFLRKYPSSKNFGGDLVDR